MYRGITGHEITGEMNKYVDPELSELLEKMLDKGYLENTVFLMFSDHGNHLNLGLRYSESGDIELRHPFFFTILGGKELNFNYKENLKKNRDRLITHFDLFDSTVGILNITQWYLRPKQHVIFDFLKEVIPKNRTCDDAFIGEIRDRDPQCRCFFEGEGIDDYRNKTGGSSGNKTTGSSAIV